MGIGGADAAVEWPKGTFHLFFQEASEYNLPCSLLPGQAGSIVSIVSGSWGSFITPES